MKKRAYVEEGCYGFKRRFSIVSPVQINAKKETFVFLSSVVSLESIVLIQRSIPANFLYTCDYCNNVPLLFFIARLHELIRDSKWL